MRSPSPIPDRHTTTKPPLASATTAGSLLAVPGRGVDAELAALREPGGAVALRIDAADTAVLAVRVPGNHVAAGGEHGDGRVRLRIRGGGVDAALAAIDQVHVAIGEAHGLDIAQQVGTVVAIGQVEIGDRQGAVGPAEAVIGETGPQTPPHRCRRPPSSVSKPMPPVSVSGAIVAGQQVGLLIAGQAVGERGAVHPLDVEQPVHAAAAGVLRADPAAGSR